MSRRSRRKYVVPGAEKAMDELKVRVMREEGYKVDGSRPENVKHAVAMDRGIPLKSGYNGRLTAEDAGKVGGPIGGAMVRELVKIAKEALTTADVAGTHIGSHTGTNGSRQAAGNNARFSK
ncbi:small, acid-soluble spore protein, alpha/beta type [Gorillibacterium massiliense]|uniref:small, acid-soluble spore protein, alpha/beta type n=1 Tax=Gorillibacterium massiliense TaxID=1280390 RepID=UPI0004B80225